MELFKLLGTIAIENAEAKKALNEVSQEGGKTESKLSKVFGAIGKGAAVCGKAIGVGLAAGATAMAGLTVKALNLSGELEQNMGGAEAVFGELGKTIGEMETPMQRYDAATGKVITETSNLEAVSKEAYKNMGLSQSDYLATANKMGALFKGAGFETQEALNLSSEAMQRAADVASIMGLDTEAAMEAVAGAAKGNFTMMDNLGVAMNDTAIQNYALEKGIKKTTAEMTQQEKIGLAMEMFMEKTAYAAGNYAKENETLAGSLATAKSALSNFLAGSGDVESLVSSFSGLANVVVKNLGEIVPRLTTGLTDVVNQIVPMIPGLLNQLLPTIIQGAVSLINGLVAALPGIVSAITAVLPMLIDGVAQIIIGLAQALPQMVQTIVDALPGVIQAIVDVLPTLIPAITDGVTQAFTAIVEALPQIIQPIIDALPELVITLVEALVDNLPAIIEGIIQLVVMIAQQTPQIIQALVDALPTVVSLLVTSLLENLPLIIEGLIQIVMAITASLPEIFTSLIEGIGNVFAGIWDALGNVFGGLGEWFGEKFGAAKEAALQKWSDIKEKFSSIKDKVTEGFSNLKEKVSTKFKEAKDSAEQKWNDAKEKWQGIKDKVVDGFSKLKDNIGTKFKEAKDNAEQKWSDAKSKFTSIKDKVVDGFSKLKDNIGTKFNDAKTGAVQKWSDIKSKFDGIKNKVVSAFSNLGSNLKTKFSEAKENALSAFNDIKEKVKSVGKNLVDGIWKGISDAKDWIKGKIKGWVGDVTKFIKKLFGIKSPSTVMRDEVGRYLAEGVAVGIEENTSKVQEKAEEMAQKVLDSAQKRLDEYSTYNELTLADEVGFWDEVRLQIEEGTDARIEADKKYFEAKKSFNDAVATADEELAADLDAIYKKISDKSKQIASTFKLFEAPSFEKWLTPGEMLNTMESQVEAFELYGTVLEQLRAKIGDTDLFKELEEMGVKALPQVFAINNMDINYLKEYLALYDQRTQLANDMAAESLADETAAETAAVYEEYAVKMAGLGVEIVESTEAMKTEGIGNMNEMLAEFTKSLEEFSPKMKLPHFSISGTLDIANGTVPTVSVEWFKKAMDNAMLLDKPTIFGYNNANGKFLGAGEAGSEVVAGSTTLMNMIQNAVAEQNGTLNYYLQKILELLATFFPEQIEAFKNMKLQLNTGALVGELVVPMDEALGILSERKDRGI